MIHTLRTQRSIGMGEFVRESLLVRRLDPALSPRGEKPAAAPTATARVDWGRWVVDCPFCPGAVLLDPDEPRTYCLQCFNEAAGHLWVRVVMPTAARRSAIEAALDDGRPVHELNWRPGQSLADVAAGAPVPGPELSREALVAAAEAAWEEQKVLRARVAELESELRDERAALEEANNALAHGAIVLQHERERADRMAEDLHAHGAHGDN